VRWAAHNVKFHRTGAKTLHHPVVGDLTLDYEALDLPGDTGQRILVYSAEPGSPSQQALDLLASWATTTDETPRGRDRRRALNAEEKRRISGSPAKEADKQGPDRVVHR
jgi:hypothetical protein